MKFLNSNVDKDNIMLLDVLYYPPRKETNREDFIDIIYKELDTGEKHIKSIKNPTIDIYFLKEQYRNYDYNKTFMEIDKCDKHSVEYKKIPWYIAGQAGDQYVNELRRLVENGRYKDIQKIQTYPYVFGSDIPIDVFYRTQWLLEYDNEQMKPLTKIYCDIEVDTISVSNFVRDGSCPINAVTVVDDVSNSVYTFLLNNPDNPLISEFVKDIDNFIEELHMMFDESYGRLSYYIYMYDSEKELLIEMFKLINTLKRDYCLFWNGLGFDIPYILARFEKLGLDPYDIICHKDFKNKICKLHEDDKNFQIANKGSYFKASTYTKYIDQMILYAATRKGQSELRSNALNVIGQKELGDEKLDYTDEANIKTLPYKNYRKFVAYNIKDVLLQMGIERKCNDIDNLYLRSYSNCTEVDKVFKQTVMLKSRAYYEYLLQGNVLGNNVNVFNKDATEGFVGALVGDPLLNSHTGIVLLGAPSMYVFDNVIDMDFSSMYPHIIISFNIERNTMIAKIIIPDVIEDKYDHIFTKTEIVDVNFDDDTDEDDDEKEENIGYDAGKDFLDNYLCGDILSIGTKWFNLPDINEINTKFKEKFNIKHKHRFSVLNESQYFADKVVITIEE